MTYDRSHDRDPLTAATAAPTTDDATPGRASRSAQLRGPDTPSVSGILMRAATGEASAADAEHAVSRASGSSGIALPDDLRSRFESSLGTDLSSVRVHTGDDSRAATSAVGAHAYALGDDIHFAAGQYDPGSERGQHLIAHEVAHTVQQRGGAAVRQNKLAMSAPGDASEMEADRAADAMIRGLPATISGASTMGRMVQRAAAEGGAEVKAGNTSSEVALTASVPMSSKGKYGTLEAKATLEVKGTLTYPPLVKNAGDAGTSAGGDSEGASKGGAEATVEGGKQELVKRELSEKSKADAQTSLVDAYTVTSVELETSGKASVEAEAKGKEGKKSASYSIGGQIKINFANAPAATGRVDIVGAKIENGKPSITGPAVSVKISSPEVAKSYQLAGGVSFTGSWTVSGSGKYTFNVTEELVKRASEKLFGEVGKSAAEGAGETAAEGAGETAAENMAALDAASLAEVAGFGAIAVSMTYAFANSAGQVEAIKDYAARGKAATESYVTGALGVLGISAAGAAPDAMFFMKGTGDYGGKLSQIIAAVKAKVDGKKLTDADIYAAVIRDMQAHADEVKGKVWQTAEPAIAKAFAEQYYKDQQGLIFKSEDRRDAERVAQRMGQPDVRLHEDGSAYEVGDE